MSQTQLFNPGDTVEHAAFGVGRIISVNEAEYS